MFKVKTLSKVKFVGKTIFSIDDIFARIEAGQKRLRINNKIVVNLNLKYLKRLYMLYKISGKNEIRCPFCGTKASHFRLVQDIAQTNAVNYYFHLYGFVKTKNKTVYMPFNIDHILPKSKGGQDIVSNFQVTCHTCNTNKGDVIQTNIETIIENNKQQQFEFLKTNTAEKLIQTFLKHSSKQLKSQDTIQKISIVKSALNSLIESDKNFHEIFLNSIIKELEKNKKIKII
jgi:hypothetical protein